MAVKQDLHASDVVGKWHDNAAGFGCVSKHGAWGYNKKAKKYYKISDREPCDYPKHGHNNAKEHHTKYESKGLAYQRRAEQEKENINAELEAAWACYKGDKYETKNDAGKADWKENWRPRIEGPIALLLKDPKAWNIDEKVDLTLTMWWGERKRRKPPAENFLPAPLGGWSYHFPYEHNYHHVVAHGALFQQVINAEFDPPVTPLRRARVIVHKDCWAWNINNEKNIALLPNQFMHARIVKLPAHCPWDRRNHPKWTDLLLTHLTRVKDKIDAAITNEDHEQMKKSNSPMPQVQETLYEKLWDPDLDSLHYPSTPRKKPEK